MIHCYCLNLCFVHATKSFVGTLKLQIYTSYICLQFAPKTFIPALFGHASDDIFIQPHHSDLIYEAYAVSGHLVCTLKLGWEHLTQFLDLIELQFLDASIPFWLLLHPNFGLLCRVTRILSNLRVITTHPDRSSIMILFLFSSIMSYNPRKFLQVARVTFRGTMI